MTGTTRWEPYLEGADKSPADGLTGQDLTFQSHITREQAIAAVRKWWGSQLMARGLAGNGQISGCRLEYVPFWKLRAGVTGSLDGYLCIGEGEDAVTVREHREIDWRMAWTGVACDLPEIGVRCLRNLSGEVDAGKPLLTLQTAVPRKEAVSRGIKAIEAEVVKERYCGLSDVTDRNIRVEPLGVDCVHYPLWIVKYAFAGRTYSATVDGITGDLRAGRAPGDFRLRCGAAVISLVLCVGATLAGIRVYQDVSWPIGLFMLLFTFLVGQAILREAFSFLVFGSRITLGDFPGGYRPFYTTRRGRCKAARTAGWAGLVVIASGLYVLFVTRESCLSLILVLAGPVVQLVPRAIISYRPDDCHDGLVSSDHVQID